MSDKLDRAISDRLKHYDAGVPMHLWDGIVSGRKTKKRGFIWWNSRILLAGLVVLAAGGLLFYQLTQSDGFSSSSELPAVSKAPAEMGPVPGTESLPAIMEASGEKGEVPEVTESDKHASASATDLPREEFTEKGGALPASDVLSSASGQMPTAPESEAVSSELLEMSVPAAVSELEREFTQDWAANALHTLTFQPEQMATASGMSPGKCVSFRNPNWSSYIDLYFSPDYAIRSLTPRSPASAPYAKLRSEESFQFAFTSGFRFNLVSPRGLGIRIGLQYAQIGELFSHVDPNAVQESIINNYDPDTGALLSSDTTYIYGTAVKEIHNYYRMIDVPVMMGYEWDFERVTFSAYGGIIANLWFSQKGQFFAPNTEDIVEFTSGKPNQFPAFKENLSAHFAGAFGLQYQFSPDGFLLLEPHFRYFPSGITRDDYPLNQKYFVSGISIGLRYKL